jgi:hypothetical protein
MTRVLALIGIVALLLYFQIPQRINWDELRGFKGADGVEKAAEPLIGGLQPQPGEKPLPKDQKSAGEQDASWMLTGCRPDTLTHGARLSKADYNRHLSSTDLNGSDPLQDGTVKPFCIHQDASKVFIPDWLIPRTYRLKLTARGEDVVEQATGKEGT